MTITRKHQTVLVGAAALIGFALAADRALKASPNHHTVTLSYYGMWHAEQGNVLEANDFLQKIAMICGGTDCEPFKNLKGVIDGKFTY